MKTTLIVLTLAVFAALALATLRSCGAAHHLDVDPHSRREIEKARRH